MTTSRDTSERRVSVVLHPVLPPGVKEQLGRIPTLELACPDDDAGVAAALGQGAPILVTYTWRPEFLTPSLRLVAGTGAGYEQYPLELLRQHHVVLTTGAGVNSACVAEHAFGLLLACTRRLGEAAVNQTERRWAPLLGEELAGKRLAIIGLGRIGEAIAVRAQGWDMEVRGLKRDVSAYAGVVSRVLGPAELPQLCQWADIAVLAAPAAAGEPPLIGSAELDALGAGWLINVGRGQLVDEEALVHALDEGQLRGAGLDVTATEPLPATSRLWDQPGVLLSAHNAGSGPGFGRRWIEIFRDNLAALNGSGAWRNRAPTLERT